MGCVSPSVVEGLAIVENLYVRVVPYPIGCLALLHVLAAGSNWVGLVGARSGVTTKSSLGWCQPTGGGN